MPVKATSCQVGMGRAMEKSNSPQGGKSSFSVLAGGEPLVSAPAPATTPVAVQESRAKEFLSSPGRLKRQLWDRTRPEVQQWYQHFLYLGFDEAVGVLAGAWLPAGQDGGGEACFGKTGTGN